MSNLLALVKLALDLFVTNPVDAEDCLSSSSSSSSVSDISTRFFTRAVPRLPCMSEGLNEGFSAKIDGCCVTGVVAKGEGFNLDPEESAERFDFFAGADFSSGSVFALTADLGFVTSISESNAPRLASRF